VIYCFLVQTTVDLFHVNKESRDGRLHRRKGSATRNRGSEKPGQVGRWLQEQDQQKRPHRQVACRGQDRQWLWGQPHGLRSASGAEEVEQQPTRGSVSSPFQPIAL